MLFLMYVAQLKELAFSSEHACCVQQAELERSK